MKISTSETVTIVRDCEALLIPTAVPIQIPEGSNVYVQQSLGGQYTVLINGNLARISNKDSDALGLVDEKVEVKNFDGPLTEETIMGQLKHCYDPEIPVNIVDLGLIYRCDIESLDGGGYKVEVDMTLTAAGCGMGPILASDVESKIKQFVSVKEVQVELVFDPPWSMDKLTDAAKLELGMM